MQKLVAHSKSKDWLIYFLVLLINFAGSSAEDKHRQLQCSYLPAHLFWISEFDLKIPL